MSTISSAAIFLDALQFGNMSGTGTYVENLLQNYRDRDTTVTALARPEQASVLEGGSIRTATTGAFSLEPILRRPFGLHRTIHGSGAEVVHFPATFGTWDAAPAQHKYAVVTTIHDLSFLRNSRWFPALRSAAYRHLVRRTVANSDRFIADSGQTADDLRSYLGVNTNRIDVVPLGVSDRFHPRESAEIEAFREQLRLPEQYALFVGTIEPRKNVPAIVHAFEMVADTVRNAHLVIAGRMGWKTANVIRTLSECGARDRIHLLDYVDHEDLPKLYAGARAFVWPSLWEGFGLPVLEAMASGVPVITTDRSSLPEVCDGAALLVDPEDIDAIGHAWLRVLHEPALRQDLIEKGRARARQLTWARSTDATLEAYDRAIANRR